jgi:hypothetical protein
LLEWIIKELAGLYFSERVTPELARPSRLLATLYITKSHAGW